MKPTISTLIFMLFFALNSKSQTINYEKNLATAQEKSKKQDKILLVIFKFVNIRDQPKINVNAVESPEVAKKINDNFIIYQGVIDADTALNKLINGYKIFTYPSILFFDTKGTALYRQVGVTINASNYIQIIDKVLKLNKEDTLFDMDRKYENKEVSRVFLEKYITKRINVSITNNANIIDDYVNYLKVDELNDFNTVKFILKAGPLAYGKAHNLINYNRAIVDSVYKTSSSAEAVELNNNIINNTMIHAVKLKSLTWANAVANFTASSWGKNYKEGQKSRSLKLIQYSIAVKDTTSFFRNAFYFYDNYYFNIPLDSIEKNKAVTLDYVKAEALKKITENNLSAIRIDIKGQEDAGNVLNNVAFKFYLTGTKNPLYLNKALAWSKRSIEIRPIYGYYDTYAHLLYRLNRFSEAIENQNKAVELAKKENLNTNSLENELSKMKSKTL